METTKKDFEAFKKECEKWYDKLRLEEWDLVYYHEDLKQSNAVAKINIVLVGKSAAIIFNKVINNSIAFKFEEAAKHEVIHLLLANISELGWSRFTTEDEIRTAEEALVRKLEKIIK